MRDRVVAREAKMKPLSWLTGVLLGYTRGLTSFEHIILDAFVRALPKELAAKLALRVSQINRVHRLDGGREVNCYVMRKGKPHLPDETRISGESGESTLGCFHVDSPDALTKNSGYVLLVDGNLFSLMFREPTEHADVANVDRIRVDIEQRKRSQ